MLNYRHNASILAVWLLSACSAEHAPPAAPPPPLPIEHPTIEAEISAGPNLFVVSTSWEGAGSISILSTDDLSFKGNFPTGLNAQFVLTPDASSRYVASIFPERISYGPVNVYLQEFDVATLTTTKETRIPPSMAQTSTRQPLIAIDPNSRWVYVQNATPATSVTVADLQADKVISEIPNPGCWGIYPAQRAAKFSSLCGDGSIVTIQLTPEGTLESQAYSDPIFDVFEKPLFTLTERVGCDLVFSSYGGEFFVISDEGDTATLTSSWSYTNGIKGDWGPGGYQIMAHNRSNGVMFVSMHQNAHEGSHKDPAQEIWAIDMKTRKVLSRSPVADLTYIAVSSDAERPVLFGVDDRRGDVYRYTVTPSSGYSLQLASMRHVPHAAYLEMQ